MSATILQFPEAIDAIDPVAASDSEDDFPVLVDGLGYVSLRKYVAEVRALSQS